MSIASEIEQLNSYATQIEKDHNDIKTALTNKKVSVPEGSKLSNVPGLIAQIKTGSEIKLIITATDFEGQTLTATKESSKFTGTVQDGKCTITVDSDGTWVVSADDGTSVEIATNISYEATLSKSKIYGVRITKAESNPNTRVVYTDDAVDMAPVTINGSTGKANMGSWADSWIMKHFYPVMVTNGGAEDYKLNPDNMKQKLDDGGNSNVTNISYNGNAMVHVDKFYTKCWSDASYEYIQVSDKKEEGFEPIGFIREDGSEMDYTYLPCYMGSFDNQNRLRSMSGQAEKVSTSYNDFVTAAKRNGSTYGLKAHPQQTFMDFLYLIMFKNDNSQTALGNGRAVGSSITTGVTDTLGAIGCDPSSKCTKFLYIEDFTFAGGYEWMEGWLTQNSKVYVKMKRPYSSTSTSGYTQVTGAATQGGSIKHSVCSNQYGRIPADTTGSSSTFQCDDFYLSTSSTLNVCLRANSGVWNRNANPPSLTSTSFGASLSFEPPA